MTITETPRGFHIQFPYDPNKVRYIKEISGSYFMQQTKTWVVPKNRTREIAFLKSKFGVSETSCIDPLMPEQYEEIPELPMLAVPLNMPRKPFAFQERGIAYCIEKKKVIIGDQPGLGKAQPLDAKIATPNGFVLMKDVFVGMEVFGSDGNIYHVTGVFPQGKKSAYKILLNDDTSVECCNEHLWQIRDVNRRRRNTGWTVKSTQQMIDSGLKYRLNNKRQATGRKQILKYELPIAKPFNKMHEDYLIHPYIMGALLGDGCLSTDRVMVSIPDFEIETKERIESLLPNNLKLYRNNYTSCPQYHITQTGTTNKNPYLEEIKAMGLNGTGDKKFIPEKYLFGSIEQRLDLLRGLMDTDGSAKNNRITFHTCCWQLANDINILVSSLGGQAIIREYDRSHENKSIEFQVNIRINYCPFYLVRKAGEWQISKRNYASRYIETIRYVGEKEMQCISVSAPDKLYLTDFFIPTHNTTQAIGACQALGLKKILVICPSTLKINWKNEWMEVAGRRASVMTSSVRNTWHMYLGGYVDIYITNYESLKKFFVEPGWKKPQDKPFRAKEIPFREHLNLFEAVIIDESHKVKDGTTQQSKFVMGICKGRSFVFELTGTPVINKPIDLIAQLTVLGKLKDVVAHIPQPIGKDGKLTDFSGYKRFLDRYCQGGKGSSNLKELNYRLNLHCFYRREKTEVLKDLPDKIRQVVLCEISNREEYEKAEHEFVDYLKEIRGCSDKEINKKLRGEMMVKIGILKQISAKGKIDDVREFLEEIIEGGEKVVLFCHLKEIVREIKNLFPGCVTITGDNSMEERDRNIRLFQNDKSTQLIICSLQAGGVGITLTASSRVVFIEFPWTYALCEQAEDRTHRIGQVNSVQCTYFLGEKTIDRYCYDLIRDKKNIAQLVTGDVGEVQEEVIDHLLTLFNQK